MVHAPKKFSDAIMKFIPSSITVYLPRSDEIVEPESIHQVPSIPETLSIHKFVRQINDRGDCIEFFKTGVDQEAFHTQWYNKANDAVCGHEESNKSDSENGIQKTRVNGYNAPCVSNDFTKHVFTFKSNLQI